ncbi:MAG: hypothetical protein EA377_01895 [Phycisphaerales bacterium]|nr:MAG: hypothetical protein EA377_01895 [Phycisphaerales bacterium]
MILRSDQSDQRTPAQPAEAGSDQPNTPRLNLLLSYGGWRQGSVVDQLPRLFEPMGIHSIRVHCGREAAEAIQREHIHIAMVDLDIPLDRGQNQTTPAGSRVLQLLRRLDQPPPTVVVRPPQVGPRDSARSLSEALREGAFAVLDRPLELETTLEVMRRVLRRHYADNWPAA